MNRLNSLENVSSIHKRIGAIILVMILVLGYDTRCCAVAETITGGFTETHTVNISNYGKVDVTVKWSYSDGSSASFDEFIGSSYRGSHTYVDAHKSYHKVTNIGDRCEYSFGVVFDDKDSYLITVYCDIYGETGEYYSYLPSVGRIVDMK